MKNHKSTVSLLQGCFIRIAPQSSDKLADTKHRSYSHPVRLVGTKRNARLNHFRFHLIDESNNLFLCRQWTEKTLELLTDLTSEHG